MEENKLKIVKEDLEDLEIYVKELYDFLPLAVCSINPAGIIINVNKAVEDLTNYDSLELVGEPMSIIFSNKNKIEEIKKEIIDKGFVHGKELALTTKDKKELPMSVSASKRKDREGNYIGYFIGLTNITEFKKFQEELEKKVKERTKELEDSKKSLIKMLENVKEAQENAEEEKNKTLAIITNFTDGLLVFDREGKLSLINYRAELFLGVKSQDVIDKSISELKDIPAFNSIMKIFKKDMKSVSKQELPLETGQILEGSTIPIIRKNQNIGNLVVLHNITREKAIETMKSDFVSLTAHQLRTPLSAIKWTLKLLLKGDFGKITKDQKEFIERMSRSTEKMILLIGDLLNITKIEEGRYIFDMTPTDMETIVLSAISLYRVPIEEKKIEFTFKKPKKFPKVKMDVEKIKLAVQNLFDNAIKYTHPKGSLQVELSCGTNEVQFKIKDSGMGIPKSQQERVFSKFFRGANVMKVVTEGTGLGLFITKNIIEAHGGKIWFESEENKGTTFYFTLPVSKSI
jgi:PAS domain S-box-containing protein